MLSKSQISLLISLQRKKERKENGLFLVEGYKSLVEFTGSRYHIEAIYHTPGFDPKVLKLSRKINTCEISVTDMSRISSLKTPQQVIALVKIPDDNSTGLTMLKDKFSIVLDGVQDPGNLGTIIRIADWFGIKNIICSEDSVDAYSPKVVQASMGSLSRVEVCYTDLKKAINSIKLPVYGALLNGEAVYDAEFDIPGFVVFGSEGNGLSPGVEQLITKKITIPKSGSAESLNVSVAAAIICSEICRRSFK